MTQIKNTEKQEKEDVEQDLRNATTAAVKALEFWKEPTKALVVIVKYLREAAKTDRVATDPVFAKFLYEDLAPGVTRKLAKERTSDDEVRYYLTQLISLFCSISWLLQKYSTL